MPEIFAIGLAILSTAGIALAIVHYYFRLQKSVPEEVADNSHHAAWFRHLDRIASLAAWVVTGFCFFHGLDAWFWWVPFSEYKVTALLLFSLFGSLFLLLGIGRQAAREYARNDYSDRTRA